MCWKEIGIQYNIIYRYIESIKDLSKKQRNWLIFNRKSRIFHKNNIIYENFKFYVIYHVTFDKLKLFDRFKYT